MTRALRSLACVLVAIAIAAGVGCRLRLQRPETIPSRMIEPQLVQPSVQGLGGGNTAQVRLLDTQARSHIGRPLLRQRPDGELIEDPVWRWSSAPDRYLDTALRLEFTSGPVRLVDTTSAPAMSATLLAWQLESAGETQLVAAVELQLTGSDHTVRTEVIRASESVSTELPGNLSAAAGRLLRRLATEASTRVASEK